MRERTHEAIDSRLERGLYWGGVTPVGYLKEGTNLVVDEDKAPLVQEMFERYDSGASKYAVKQWW